MKITVKYFGYLADYGGGREVVVEAPEGARVRDVVRLPPGVSLEELVILVNGKPARPDTALKNGDVVSVLPHISGGAEGPHRAHGINARYWPEPLSLRENTSMARWV